MSGSRLADDGERRRQLCHVSRPDCVAVHGGGIERRLGDERLQRLRQYAAARLLDGDGLGLGRGHAVEDALQGFFDREQGHDVYRPVGSAAR